jgi:hypothetical protein
MKPEEWDDEAMRPLRAAGARSFPSRADVDKLCRDLYGDKWTEEIAHNFIVAFAHGTNAGLRAAADCAVEQFKPRTGCVRRSAPENDAFNLWGLLPW